MAFAVRTAGVASGGASSGTGDRTATFTPAVGDLVIVYCCVAANANNTPTCSDNNGSGTYDRIAVMDFAISTVNYRMSVFIRTALMVNTTSTVITVATGSNTSGTIHVVPVTGISRTGSNAVRSSGSQNNQAAGTAAPVLNQAALTGNGTMVAQGSADTTTTPPTNWTEVLDTSQSNDTVALECASRASGFTGTTITFGAASSTQFCSHAMELDTSTLFTRSALVDGAGAVISAATFFTVFARSSIVGVTGLVASVGQRSLMRSTATNATGAIVSTGIFFTVFSGAVVLNSNATIDSAGSFLSVLTGSAVVNVNATLVTSSTFFSITEGATFLNVNASVDVSGAFFSISTSTSLVNGIAGIESSGQGVGGLQAFERSASIEANANLASIGLAILERSALVSTSTALVVSSSFFSLIDAAAVLDAAGDLNTSGQRDLSRSTSLGLAGDMASTAIFLSIMESSSLLTGLGAIESSGTVGAARFERTIAINCEGSIISAGIRVGVFRPRGVVGIDSEVRRFTISREVRDISIPSEIQLESI